MPNYLTPAELGLTPSQEEASAQFEARVLEEGKAPRRPERELELAEIALGKARALPEGTSGKPQMVAAAKRRIAAAKEALG